jgi:transcriptional regulator with XRE-family HTH domain
LELKIVKSPAGWVQNPISVGEKLRNRRLILKLSQVEAAERMGVPKEYVSHWETNRYQPQIKQYPVIIAFLGYCPWDIDTGSLGGKIKMYRYLNGLSQENLATELGVSESTIYKLEGNQRKPLPGMMKKLEPILAATRQILKTI